MRSADGLSVRPQLQCTLPPLAIECQVLSLVVILLVVWPVCIPQGFAQNLQPDNQSNTVRGTVVNAVTNQPIGRALVYSPDNRYAMFTDSEGHFEFTLPKQELYSNRRFCLCGLRHGDLAASAAAGVSGDPARKQTDRSIARHRSYDSFDAWGAD